MNEASQFGTGQVFVSMLWFFLFFIWIWLLVVVFGDIFRSDDLGWLGQGALDDLRDRASLSGRVRVPDRPWPQDGRARRGSCASARRRETGLHPQRRRFKREWHGRRTHPVSRP